MDKLVCVEDYEAAALTIWDDNAKGYYARSVSVSVFYKFLKSYNS